jgi:branched-chain amino acid transport system ATP-binding protein
MAGLTPKEVEEAVELVKRIHQREITIILVEQVMKGVMPIADRMVVLDNGKKIAEDTPLKIVEDAKVKKAYFGESS